MVLTRLYIYDTVRIEYFAHMGFASRHGRRFNDDGILRELRE